jgi:predicted nucleic acid-binding protein
MKPWAYFDTSVIVKLYVAEGATLEAKGLVRKHSLLSSVLLPLEVTAALARRRAAGEVTPGDFSTALGHFQEDQQFFEWVELARGVRQRVEALLQVHAIRTLDAIHIASALLFKERVEIAMLPFITGDKRQFLAAQTLGLETLWVGE